MITQREWRARCECAGADRFAVIWHQFRDLRADQGIGPDQHIGLSQTFRRSEREQIGGSWTASNEADRVGQLLV